MHAVLLFSALLHLAAVGLAAALAVRSWLETRRPKEPGFPEIAGLAATLGLGVLVVVTILLWMAGPFGHALMLGLVGGGLAALCFLLGLGALPSRPGHGGPANQAVRIAAVGFVGLLILTELIAFSFLVAAASASSRFT